MFNHLLDDTPLPANEVSSSVLVASYSHMSLQNGKGAIGGGKPGSAGEVEKGLLTLISSDGPGLQVSLFFFPCRRKKNSLMCEFFINQVLSSESVALHISFSVKTNAC